MRIWQKLSLASFPRWLGTRCLWQPERVISPRQQPSQWPLLFDLASDIIARTTEAVGREPDWSFGGGTALMLQIDHRESHDIDLFLSDPQFLPYLNPETQGFEIERMPDTYETDGAGSLKLIFEDIGEIDFICCADITPEPSQVSELRGRTIRQETPAEIVAKKVYYRGASMQPRDMFDIAATSEKLGQDYVINAFRECGVDRCANALRAAENMKPEFASSIIKQLMYRDHNGHLVEEAQAITVQLLRATLGA